MRRSLFIFLIVIMAGLISLTVFRLRSNQAHLDQGSEIKIGLVLPITGPLAFLGESHQKAAEMAIEDIKKESKQSGVPLKHIYRTVIEDDQFLPKYSVTAASKLTSVDAVSAIISFGSGTGNAVNPIAEKSQTPHFGLASDPHVADGAYNYIHWTPPFIEGQMLAHELERRGLKRLAIIDTNHPGPLAVTDALKESLNNSSVDIVMYHIENPGQKDFKTVLQKVKNSGADILLLELFSPDIEIAMRQMKESGLNIPVTSVEAIEWSDDLALFDGQWFISDAESDVFAKKYTDRYGVEPKAGAAYIYDIIKLIATIEEHDIEQKTPSELNKKISELTSWNSGVYGDVPINKDGFFITKPTVNIVKGGKVIVEK